MTSKEFETFWASAYSETIPIPCYFKYDYADRWFRIHSLPESKRYAENLEEWSILLDRHNTIINELLGAGKKFLLVTGDSERKGYTELHPITEIKSIEKIPFTFSSPIDLHKFSLEEYEAGHIYKPMFSEQVWQSKKFDDLLRDIANADLKAFFVSPQNECIVAPYDGGIDIIVKDSQTKDALKVKYNQWISEQKDGL